MDLKKILTFSFLFKTDARKNLELIKILIVILLIVFSFNAAV